MVICLERGTDLNMAQLMSLPLTVSCFSKIQIGVTFLVPAHLGSPGKGPLNGCVCVCMLFLMPNQQCQSTEGKCNTRNHRKYNYITNHHHSLMRGNTQNTHGKIQRATLLHHDVGLWLVLTVQRIHVKVRLLQQQFYITRKQYHPCSFNTRFTGQPG